MQKTASTEQQILGAQNTNKIRSVWYKYSAIYDKYLFI